MNIKLEELPLNINNGNNKNPGNMFSLLTNSVEVYYIIYNFHKKTIIKMGSSKAIGKNNNKMGSIHAEELAIKYCLKYDKKKKYQIYIWKWSNNGSIKEKFCCSRCCLLINKYNFTNKIFTFKNNKKISAYTKYPTISLYYLINK